MDLNELAKSIINAWVNQALINRENNWIELPTDQEEALENMLKALDSLIDNRAKISPEYLQQVSEAFVIKLGSRLNG